MDMEWMAGALLAVFGACVALLGVASYWSDLENACAKAHNVYACEWVAVPVDMNKGKKD
jgi:hypothetical protein